MLRVDMSASTRTGGNAVGRDTDPAVTVSSTAEQTARYLADPRQCVDCGGHPAAGMPRCYACHDIWKAAQLPPPPPFVIKITWTDKKKANQ